MGLEDYLWPTFPAIQKEGQIDQLEKESLVKDKVIDKSLAILSVKGVWDPFLFVCFLSPPTNSPGLKLSNKLRVGRKGAETKD